MTTYRVQATAHRAADLLFSRDVKARDAEQAVNRMAAWMRREGWEPKWIKAEDSTGHDYYELNPHFLGRAF